MVWALPALCPNLPLSTLHYLSALWPHYILYPTKLCFLTDLSYCSQKIHLQVFPPAHTAHDHVRTCSHYTPPQSLSVTTCAAFNTHFNPFLFVQYFNLLNATNSPLPPVQDQISLSMISASMPQPSYFLKLHYFLDQLTLCLPSLLPLHDHFLPFLIFPSTWLVLVDFLVSFRFYFAFSSLPNVPLSTFTLSPLFHPPSPLQNQLSLCLHYPPS